MDDAISRQAAIDALGMEPMAYTEYEQGLHDEWIDAKENIEALPSAQRWIPCSERLPEDDVEVLVTDDSGGVQWLGIDSMLSYEDGSGRFWISSQNPTAWMPLPKPWKGEQG